MEADLHLQRQAHVGKWLVQRDIDVLLVTHLPNIRYLTGFTGSAALCLLRRDGAVLVTDFRYAVQAPREVGSAAAVVIDPVDVWQRMAGQLAGATTLGIETAHLPVRSATRLSDLTRAKLVPTNEVVEALRLVKTPGELAAIRAAAALAAEALDEVLAEVRVGRTEFAIAGDLEAALRRRGSEWHPFPTIVASGPRSALPHARTSGRELEAGDLVLVDFGAQVDGYCADLTRTYVVGRPADEKQRAIFDLVRRAQARAIAGLRPGLSGREADALARDLIAEHGFGEAFGHSLGHGLGLEVHEGPRLGRAVEAPIPAGAVVTVEPGVYLPGWGGVRVEDDVHIAAEGVECLSGGQPELTELR